MQGYLCAGTLDFLEDNRGIATVRCPLCSSIYSSAQFKGLVCKTCEICTLGADSIGLCIQLEAGGQPTGGESAGASASNMKINTADASNLVDPMASAMGAAVAGGNDLFL